MMTGRSWMPAWTTVAALSLAAIGSTATEASDFIHFNYNKYLPNSVRSKIESYVGKVDVAGGRIATAPASACKIQSDLKTPSVSSRSEIQIRPTVGGAITQPSFPPAFFERAPRCG